MKDLERLNRIKIYSYHIERCYYMTYKLVKVQQNFERNIFEGRIDNVTTSIMLNNLERFAIAKK